MGCNKTTKVGVVHYTGVVIGQAEGVDKEVANLFKVFRKGLERFRGDIYVVVAVRSVVLMNEANSVSDLVYDIGGGVASAYLYSLTKASRIHTYIAPALSFHKCDIISIVKSGTLWRDIDARIFLPMFNSLSDVF